MYDDSIWEFRKSSFTRRSLFSALEREDVLPLVKNDVSRESYIEVIMPEVVKLYRPKNFFDVTICCRAYYIAK